MYTSSIRAWIIWFIVSIFYSYQYILRIIPNLLMDDIIYRFDISNLVFGQFSGIYYISYALMHIPIAILFDRYGTKIVMSVCVLFAVVGLLPMIFTNNWIYLLLGRFLIGIGSSAAILGILKIVRLFFSEQIFTRMLSMSLLIGIAGGVYGSGPLRDLYAIIGYKNLIIFLILIGLILNVVVYVFIPREQIFIKNTIIADLKSIMMNYKLITICCLGGLMIGPLEGFSDAWGSAFLKHIYNLEPSQVSYLLSMIFVGILCGLPLIGYIADKTKSHMTTAIISGIGMLTVFIALLGKILSTEGIAIGLFIVGIFSTYQNLIIYKASTYVPMHQKSLSSAITNMIMMSFGYGFHSCIGMIINTYQQNISKAYIYAISIIPISLTLGILGLMLLKYKEN